MPITPGTRLGPYEITAPLGAGGMGEVYRAKDTRLGRDVAVKVLPAHLSSNPDLRARFEREAKAVSSLNHPSICTLHDVGREGETDYLVMELVEGETLQQRLLKGPLPASEALKVGSQIADALDRAHRAGVVHRDLKPGNVMLTRTGAKLMDFGLARAGAAGSPAPGSGSSMLTNSPTVAAPLTAEGAIIGTFMYMAPEQLEGREADERSDLWSLGCVLYEMATGKRAFEGTSQASLIVAIMSSTPPSVTSLQPMSPPALEYVIRTCLAKDPDQRFQSAHDVKLQLQWVAEGGSQAGVPAPVVAGRRNKGVAVTAMAIAGWALAVMALAWAVYRGASGGNLSGVFRSEWVAPGNLALRSTTTGAVALSPDGKAVVMAVAVDSSATALAVRDCSTGETRVLNGTDDAGFPFWSPDGKWIAFFTDGKLRKIPAAGGPVITVCAAHAGRGGSWSERGEIVFAADITGPIYRVSPDGGAPVAVTHVQSANWTNRMPYFLPDGRHFLFVERESVTDPYGHVMVASIDGGPAKKLLEQGSNPQYSGGYLLCSRDGTLCAQRLDAGSLELKGSVIPLFGGLEYYNPRDVANFSVSHNGVLVYRLENHEPVRFAWIDRSGHEVSTIGEPGQFEFQQLSRDSRTLLVIRHDTDHRGQDLWTIDVDRGTTTRSTQIDLEGNLSGTFSPDGTRLAVSSPAVAGKGGDLWIQPVSGSQIERTVLKTSRFYVQEWSPDGKYLIGDEQVEGTGHNVFLVRLDEASTSSKPMLNAVYDERPQGVSADGKWLAYSSTESGTLETYVTDFPSATRKYQISQGGSSTAVWSADGRELFYYAGSGWVSVSLLAGPTLQISAPKRVSLPEGAYLCGTRGSQLLVLRPDHTPAVEPLRVVQNWQGTLPR